MTKQSGKHHDEDRSLDLYLREIGKTPLISAKEEVDLARKIKQGDQQALERLTKANLRFVVTVAKKYQNQGLSLGDLIAEGNVGLMRAAKRFDEARGFKFISYAVWWIRQAILQALAEQSRVVRLPLNRVGTVYKINKVSSKLEQNLGRPPSPDEIAQELQLPATEVSHTLKISKSALSLDAPFSQSEGNSLIDILEDGLQTSPDETLESNSLRTDIRKALATLTPREADVINLYFGLNHQKAMTLDQIGAQFSLTRERVRQIKEKALRRLRHVSRSRSLRLYST